MTPRDPTDRIIVRPDERMAAVIGVIRGAQRRLVLSIFKCNEPRIFKELAAAARRGVAIEAILNACTPGRKRRRLRRKLDRVGVIVREPRDLQVKYHAKYVVADSCVALLGSPNLTRRCFGQTCDFLLRTTNRDLLDGMERIFEYDGRPAGVGHSLDRLSSRLILAPDNARERVRTLLTSARRRIALIDPRVTDAEMIGLLRDKLAEGVEIDVLGQDVVGGLRSHGKLLIVDDEVAMIGSLSLWRSGLDERRELAALVSDHDSVAELARFFEIATEYRAVARPELDAAAC